MLRTLARNVIEDERGMSALERFGLFAAVLSVIVFIGSMPHLFLFVASIPGQVRLLILLVLTTPVVFWVGSRFFIGAFKAARQRTTDMNTLVALGALSAYLYSGAVTFFPTFFEAAGITPHAYFDGAAMIVTLILLGRYLEARAKGRTTTAIKKLMGLRPKTARVILDNEEVDENNFTGILNQLWLRTESPWLYKATVRYDYDGFRSWRQRIHVMAAQVIDSLMRRNFASGPLQVWVSVRILIHKKRPFRLKQSQVSNSSGSPRISSGWT